MSTGMQKPQNYHLNKIIPKKLKQITWWGAQKNRNGKKKTLRQLRNSVLIKNEGSRFVLCATPRSGLLLWLHPMINGIEEDLPKQATKMMAGVIVLILDLEKIDLFGLLLQSQRLLDDWISYGRQISWSRSALKQGEASQNALKTKRSFERAILSAKLGSKK